MKTFTKINEGNTYNPYSKDDVRYKIYEMIKTDLTTTNKTGIEGISELTEKLYQIYLKECYKSEIEVLENIKKDTSILKDKDIIVESNVYNSISNDKVYRSQNEEIQ
jgi:hypothetical protein